MQLDYLRSQKTQLEAMKNDTKALTELFQAQAMKHDDEASAELFEGDAEVEKRHVVKITEGKFLLSADDTLASLVRQRLTDVQRCCAPETTCPVR
jgi:hypothetical protein